MSAVVVIFKRFERFWHWAQAAMVLLLIVTGFELHGFFRLFGFADAVSLHDWAGFSWAVLLVLAFTWIFTSGEWRQYLPRLEGLGATVRFYLLGVFKGESHPHDMTPAQKFNPLQGAGYLGIVFGLLPLQVATGCLYFFFPELRAAGWLQSIDWVAWLHTFNAYSLLSFLVIHLYMITFGKRISSHLRAMITGKEEV
ncbi:cytochrome b/b6 domain-containing protein [Corallincola spongiicola]|uniref:Cytochrome b561 bacterial/Ni-hydrogenase domain-containing protein n=1 Tax=Corallincola spongiicola TaxID=2520508 RepID=A0ABY1WQN7_9GAMM|nr:cytochrome b/b6 domain-containing protein [Corallincola spongiicola]TAA47039.1 hypothetical protein EXY25_07275 [Corallincola spongiicola]